MNLRVENCLLGYFVDGHLLVAGKQFNFLRALVKADREADKNCEDEPKRMEKLLMDFCRTKVGIKDPQDNANLDGAHNNAAARAMENVEAESDSDDD